MTYHIINSKLFDSNLKKNTSKYLKLKKVFEMFGVNKALHACPKLWFKVENYFSNRLYNVIVHLGQSP